MAAPNSPEQREGRSLFLSLVAEDSYETAAGHDQKPDQGHEKLGTESQLATEAGPVEAVSLSSYSPNDNGGTKQPDLQYLKHLCSSLQEELVLRPSFNGINESCQKYIDGYSSYKCSCAATIDDDDGDNGSRKVCESLCPGYVKEIQTGMAEELLASLTRAGETVDQCIKTIDQRCARLMTTLKPQYVLAGLSLPDTPPIKSLTSFSQGPTAPEESERLGNVSMETINLLIFRTRKLLLDEKTKDKYDDHANDDLDLIDTIIMKLSNRYNREILGRFQRKIDWAIDRVESVERYRLDLVKTLHCRDITSKEDINSMKIYKEQFRFPSDTEPIIFQTNHASHEGKNGALIITATHICFYATSALDYIQSNLLSLLPATPMLNPLTSSSSSSSQHQLIIPLSFIVDISATANITQNDNL